MTQEQEELLLKDLCMRMPYGVKVKFRVNEVSAIENKFIYNIDGEYSYITDEKSYLTLDIIKALFNSHFDEIKPYLFPLSSMTNKQKKELSDICNCTLYVTDWEIILPNYEDNNMDNWQKVLNWCYENHYDINGLIPMGLAKNATGKHIY